MNRVEELKDQVAALRGVVTEADTRLTSLRQQRSTAQDEYDSLKEAISLAKKCVEDAISKKKYIEDIVSAGLTEVFGTSYTFVLEEVLGTDGILKGLKPRLKEGDGELDDPLQSFGAGAQAIASVCFRMAILLLSTETAKVLVLDEPLANVSPTLQSRFQAFVENTCRETGLQLIMVTHMEDPFGKVYSVNKERRNKIGVSKVTEYKK